MKTDFKFELEEIYEVDEYDDAQYETSTEQAASFIDETVIPLLDKFDYENPDPEYIPGCAAFGAFTRLVGLLIEQGFTTEELKQTVDDFASPSAQGEVVH
jgi:hypothetical protein